MLSRLSLKIIAAISISVLVIQLVFIGYIEKSIYASGLFNVNEQQAKFTEANAMYIAELISEENEDNLYLILSAIVANPLIVGASLHYTDVRDSLTIGAETTKLEFSFDIKDLDDNDDLVTVGTLTTYATTEFIDEARVARIYGLLGLVLIVFLVVLAVSVIAVQAFVGIPLKRITGAIISYTRVPENRWNNGDEMGAVVSRLNFLHTELNDRLSGLEQELIDKERQESARITSLANATLEGILIFSDDQIIDLNEPMANLFGQDRELLVGTLVSDLFESDILNFLKQPIAQGTRPSMGASFNNTEHKEVPVEIHLTSMDEYGSASKVAVVRDISERVAAEKSMWRLAHYDSLTGLPNRRYFSEKLGLALQLARQHNTSLSVAYLDLDNFKFVNDSRGHSVGDQLLCGVAESLREAFGSSEQCARLGGDEFAILFEEKNLTSSLEEILGGVLAGIQNGEQCRTWNNIFSVSIGAATLSGQDLSESELLTRADLALYKAKETGRARVCFYSDNLDAKLKRARLIEERLVPAIEQDQLELLYQAQVLCDGLTITGFEALLRWNDPLLGDVSPDEIIEIAERAGLVLQLGRWVISNACRDASTWPTPLRLAVNISPLQLVDEELPSFIKSCLERTGLAANRFEIEITETALVSDAGKAQEIISTFKNMGILIALDDFGTGYSSLSMLQNYPFDRIKIDRSFVSDLSKDKGKASIVASIIDLGTRLGLAVIAEGVESESDIATLLEFNCLECQGFLINRPIPLDKVAGVINQYGGASSKDVVVKMAGWQLAS